jgi:hypothetical protein
MRAALLAAFVALSSSGCNSVKCGPGTFSKGDSCVNYDPSDHTPPTTMIMPGSVRSRAAVPDPITLVANEPATVYYTIDGTDPDPTVTPGHRDMATIRNLPSPSTVKFFSIDTAGNREAEQSATFVQDLQGPAPVTGMNVVVTGTTAHVTWTNPTDADFAGTAVARVVDVVDAVPTDGQIPMLSDSLSPSLQIVSTGNATSVDDPGVKPGIVRYVAWAYDDLGNFSTTATASTTVPLGSTDAVLVYDTTQSKLTIQSAPADIDISMTTAAVNTGTLTVSLTAINKSNTYLINPKVEVTGVTNATFSNSDGTADTFPFKTLGPNAFGPTTMVMTGLQFATTGTTITVNLRFAHHPSMLTTLGYRYYRGLQLVDTGTGIPNTGTFTFVSPGPAGRSGGNARKPAVIAGHFLDVPTTHGAIERFDLATGMAAGVATASTSTTSNLQGLIAFEGGELAIVKLASKGRGRYGENRDGKVEIVRLDEGLHVLKTVDYGFTDTTGTCQPALSPDGSTLAIAAGSSVALIDAHTLAQIDADTSTPDPDVFNPQSTGRIGSIVWLNNTDLFVLTRRNGQAAVIKRTGNTYSASVVNSDVTTYSGGFGAALATDGKVWMSLPAAVKVYDPATGLTTTLAGYTPTPTTGVVSQGIVRTGNDIWIIHGDLMGADRVATDGTKLQSISLPILAPSGYLCSPGCNGIYGHWLQMTQ